MESSAENELNSHMHIFDRSRQQANEQISDNHDAIEGNLQIIQSNAPLNEDAVALGTGEDDVIELRGNGNTVVDGAAQKNAFSMTKEMAEGMMDIALLTANANQLRFLLTYNTASRTFYVSVALIAASLVIQVAVGIALIFKSRMKIRGKRRRKANSRTNDFLVGGVFIVTVINVFAAAFTTTTDT